MSLLYEKLADAEPRHPFAAFRQPIVCRICNCYDDNACVTADGPCSWVLIDTAYPSGICSACAEELGWHRFFLPDAMFVASDQQRAA